MGEIVDKKDDYTIHIKGSKPEGEQRICISHPDYSVIQDILLHGTIEEAHFYALGFIDGHSETRGSTPYEHK